VLAPDVVKNVRLDAVMPRTVVVYKETRVQRHVPVRLRSRIRTPDGHHLVGAPVLDPDSVWVSGAASIVGSMRWWPTSSEPVDARKDTLDAVASLSDSLSGLVLLSADEVRVRGQVREFTEASRLVEVVVVDAPDGRAVSLEPSRVRMTFQVPLGQYDEAMSVDLPVVVPWSVVSADTTGSVVPVPRLPDHIAFRGIWIEPPTLRYFEVVD